MSKRVKELSKRAETKQRWFNIERQRRVAHILNNLRKNGGVRFGN